MRVGSTIFGARDYGVNTSSNAAPPQPQNTATASTSQSGDTGVADTTNSIDKNLHSTEGSCDTATQELYEGVNRLNVEDKT